MLAPKQNGCRTRFITILKEIAPEDSSLVLESYHIEDDTSDDDAWLSILSFANDICFHAPARAYVTAWPSAAYQYRFREPNPWDGPWKGHSTHVLDVAYLFLNYNEFLTPPQTAFATQFATDVISFVNGVSPFPAFEQASPFVKEYISDTGEDHVKGRGKREDSVWPELFSRVGYDTLSAVWAKFLSS